jgi:hypothetical protein
MQVFAGRRSSSRVVFSDAMQPFLIRIEVASLTANNFTAIEAMVDGTTSHSGFPSSLLASLGIVPTERDAGFILRSGARRRFDLGPCRIRFDAKTIYHDVVFLDDEMPAQIGFVTLSAYGLQIDAGKLIPLERRMPSILAVP